MQILPGDAAVALLRRQANHPAGNVRKPAGSGSILLLPVRSSTFTNQTFAKQGNQESRYEFAARRSLHAGIISNVLPNEVCWKNLLRHLRLPQPAGSRSKSFTEFHMLELAKGFEPPTP